MKFIILALSSLVLIVLVGCQSEKAQLDNSNYQIVDHILEADTTTYYLGLILPHPDIKEIPDDEVNTIQKAHRANISRLADEGLLRLAGPFWLEGNVHIVRGLFIYEVDSQKEADSLAQTDPAVINQRLVVKNYPWINSKNLTYDKEAEMRGYQSVIFSYNQTDHPISFSKLYQNQTELLKQIDLSFSIVMAGPIIYDTITTDQPHSLFIFNADSLSTVTEMINSLPPVKDSLLSANIMDWYGASGILE